MQKETVTFDKLPEAVGYLTEQVIELKKMVAELQPQPSDKHVLVEIEDACRIIRKAKPTIYTLVRKGLLPAYKKGLPICRTMYATSPNHQCNFNRLGYGYIFY